MPGTRMRRLPPKQCDRHVGDQPDVMSHKWRARRRERPQDRVTGYRVVDVNRDSHKAAREGIARRGPNRRRRHLIFMRERAALLLEEVMFLRDERK